MSHPENDRIAEAERERLIEQWADKSWMIPEIAETLREIQRDVMTTPLRTENPFPHVSFLLGIDERITSILDKLGEPTAH